MEVDSEHYIKTWGMNFILSNISPFISDAKRQEVKFCFRGSQFLNHLSDCDEIPVIATLKFVKQISAPVLPIHTNKCIVSDTTMERNTLMSQCYPKLKDYCREKHGLEFQVRQPHTCCQRRVLY